MRRVFFALALGLLITGFAGMALTNAADYPTKPITVIVPVSPGGSHDILSRIFGSVAEKYIGQPFVNTYKPGASTMVGSLEVAKAAPDGYTLLVAASTTPSVIAWELYNGRKPPFTLEDFSFIGAWTKSPTVVVVPYNSPYKTLADLVKGLKAKPGQLAYGSGGLYGSTHVPVILFLEATETKARHVPFTGGGPTLNALVGGHIDFACQFPSTCIPLARGNKLRILAVQSSKRLGVLPDTPTLKELGYKDAEFYMSLGLAAPAKTPKAVVDKLRSVFKKTMEDKTFIERVEKAGNEVEPIFGDDWYKFLKDEVSMYQRVYKQAGAEKK